jgi:hypothetical protein
MPRTAIAVRPGAEDQRSALVPLGPLQSVWFFELLRSGAILQRDRVVQVRLPYDAQFDVAALAAAWQRAIRAHPVLAMALAWSAGADAFWQHDPDAALPLEVLFIDPPDSTPVTACNLMVVRCERSIRPREQRPKEECNGAAATRAVTELHVAGGHMEFLFGDERIAVSRAIALGMEQAFDAAVSIAQR